MYYYLIIKVNLNNYYRLLKVLFCLELKKVVLLVFYVNGVVFIFWF